MSDILGMIGLVLTPDRPCATTSPRCPWASAGTRSRPIPAQRLRGADVVVDCTDSATGLQLATELVRPDGAVVMKTTVHNRRSPTRRAFTFV